MKKKEIPHIGEMTPLDLEEPLPNQKRANNQNKILKKIKVKIPFGQKINVKNLK